MDRGASVGSDLQGRYRICATMHPGLARLHGAARDLG
jgi:hypothetical protein